MPARPLHAAWARTQRAAAGVVHRPGRRRTRHQLRRAADARAPPPSSRCTTSRRCTTPSCATPPRWPTRVSSAGPCAAAPGCTPTPRSWPAEVVEAFGAVPEPRAGRSTPAFRDLPDIDEADAEAARRRLLPAGNERYCLAVGTAEPRKDLPGLVRAFGEASPAPSRRRSWFWPAHPAGASDALASALGRLALPRPHRAHRMGRTPVTWPPCSSGAAVLAYPSLYEGFGFPPLQAMRAGVPVVATRAGSLPEVLGRRRAAGRPRATTTRWWPRSTSAWATTRCGRG